MSFELKIKKDKESEFIKKSFNAPISLEALSLEFASQVKYQILLAEVDHRYRELGFKLDQDAEIVFHDIRDVAAWQAYSNSVLMLYLAAVNQVLGPKAHVKVGNELNQGLYTYIYNPDQIDDKILSRVERQMKRLVSKNLPIKRHMVKASEAIELWKQNPSSEKLNLIASSGIKEDVEIYELDGYANTFYSYMVPSTAYLKLWEISRYRGGVLLRFPNSWNPDSIPRLDDEVKLYDAYRDAMKIRKDYGIDYLGDLNTLVNQGKQAEIISLSEETHSDKIKKFAREIIDSNKRLVMIAGPSSSGKTTFAKRLGAVLKANSCDTLYIGTDDYFVDRDKTPLGSDGEPDFEALETVDRARLSQDLRDLLQGKTVDLPIFDFLKGTSHNNFRQAKINDSTVIIIEGIHCLNDKLLLGMDDIPRFKIYISPLTQLGIDRHNVISSADARMLRRMVRDYKYRGRTPEATLLEWHKVRYGENRNIFPYCGEADAVFNTSTVYETSLLKKYAEPLLQAIKPGSPAFAEALRILYFLKYFVIIDDDELVPEESIIREFIGPLGGEKK